MSIVAVALALALGACGGSPSASRAGPAAAAGSGGQRTIVGCSLFTQQDAEGLLGALVENNGNQPGLKGLGNYSSTCAYGMTDSPYDQVSVKFVHYSSATAAHQAYNISRQEGLYSKGQDVPGVGDAAVFANILGPNLLALRGSLTLQLGTTKGVPVQALQQLAKTVLARTG
jgi:hypothetical protein